MSPNPNYVSGRKEEYACMARWRAKGYEVARSAASHGLWDVCAVQFSRKVVLIQVKVVAKESTAESLLYDFTHWPPLLPSENYHLTLEVRVKGSKKIMSVTV